VIVLNKFPPCFNRNFLYEITYFIWEIPVKS
jgi:hypothetical protein